MLVIALFAQIGDHGRIDNLEVLRKKTIVSISFLTFSVILLVNYSPHLV